MIFEIWLVLAIFHILRIQTKASLFKSTSNWSLFYYFAVVMSSQVHHHCTSYLLKFGLCLHEIFQILMTQVGTLMLHYLSRLLVNLSLFFFVVVITSRVPITISDIWNLVCVYTRDFWCTIMTQLEILTRHCLSEKEYIFFCVPHLILLYVIYRFVFQSHWKFLHTNNSTCKLQLTNN